MRIKIDGVEFEDWRYAQAEWWLLSRHAALQRIPTDGTSVLVEGPPMVVDELRRSGRLAVNVSSDTEVPCGLPIKGICFACP